MQYPVKPVTDAEFLLVGFNVNIGSLLADRIHQDFVHKAHHRRVDFCGVGRGWRRGFRRHVLKAGVFVEIRKL